MEGFRVANFALQSAYLIGHLAFIVWFSRKSQPTPVWRWFTILNASFWLWVAGRFMETVVYLFFPQDNGLYQFAANFQYLGDTTAGIAFAIWNLYLAGHDRLAANPPFRAVMAAIPVAICVLVFTNDAHHLIYVKLDMGQRVVHGPLFLPCLASVALVVLAGYAVAVAHIAKTGRDKLKRLLVFSLYPAVPFTVAIIRTASGIDQLDFTPLALAISVCCLYLIVFRYNYAKIIPLSIEAALEQTAHPLCVYNLAQGEVTYANRVARDIYSPAISELVPLLGARANQFEGLFDGRFLRVDVTPLPRQDEILVTATDLTAIAQQRMRLDEQIAELQRLSESLDEENRNIDAYLDSLNHMQPLQDKRALVDEAYDDIDRTLDSIEGNFAIAKGGANEVDGALEDNLRLSRECIARIRATVAQLKEAS